ncbi:MAG: hypothetical protein IJJ42_12760 [Clostridia bacterium]|nr:hypothetical protein [Clostridia bacterium]
MNRRRIIGILLIVLSLALIVIGWKEIEKTITLSGLFGNSVAYYNPPFPWHGPLVVLGGVVAVVLFLVGLYLVSPGRRR